MMMDHHQHQHKYTMDPNNDEREEKDDPFASAKTSEEKLQILDESLSESLDFEYLVTPWSACSQTCGAKGSGYRVSNNIFNIYDRCVIYNCPFSIIY